MLKRGVGWCTGSWVETRGLGECAMMFRELQRHDGVSLEGGLENCRRRNHENSGDSSVGNR